MAAKTPHYLQYLNNVSYIVLLEHGSIVVKLYHFSLAKFKIKHNLKLVQSTNIVPIETSIITKT